MVLDLSGSALQTVFRQHAPEDDKCLTGWEIILAVVLCLDLGWGKNDVFVQGSCNLKSRNVGSCSTKAIALHSSLTTISDTIPSEQRQRRRTPTGFSKVIGDKEDV